MSHDPEQEYFSDGITEDIITDLSKVGGLIVIARNSSFAYKGKAVDIRNVGRELGVRSVLEGSIRRAGNRVRITAQLIDAADGAHLWAERYDRDLTDIFAVQDEVTREIVTALKVTLTPGEQARISEMETNNPEAHDSFLRARELLSGSSNRAIFQEAAALFEKAIALDPGYASAYAGLGFANSLDYNNNWTGDPPAALRRARELAAKAIALAPDNPYGHYVMGVSSGLGGDLDAAKASIEKALALNPNYAAAHNSRGAFAIFTGHPADAIPHVEQAIRLDPTNSRGAYLHFVGLAHLLLGNYETAAAVFRERIRQAPKSDLTRTMLASALGHLGEIEAARRTWDELLAINPDYDFEQHIGRLPFQNPADAARIREGVAKAGLPKPAA
jgi:adenylate cyclase